jgi:DNA-binding response OmpR family regulator
MSDIPTDQGGPGGSGMAPRSVFVVEPEILVRMVVADYLRECGYIVIEGNAAADVFAVLNAGRPIDIVLADIRLHGAIDGFSLAKWLHDNHPATDVMLTSSVPRTAEKAGEICDEGPLQKPYHPREVVRRVTALQARRRTIT